MGDSDLAAAGLNEQGGADGRFRSHPRIGPSLFVGQCRVIYSLAVSIIFRDNHMARWSDYLLTFVHSTQRMKEPGSQRFRRFEAG